jgi:hypothetical protein
MAQDKSVARGARQSFKIDPNAKAKRRLYGRGALGRVSFYPFFSFINNGG